MIGIKQLFRLSLVLIVGVMSSCNGEDGCLALACKKANLKNVSEKDLNKCSYAKNWKPGGGILNDVKPVCPSAFRDSPASHCNHFIIYVDGEASEAQPLEGCTECNYEKRESCQ